jgi:hypothetical protein
VALFANGLDASFNNSHEYVTFCIITKSFGRYYINILKLRREEGMTIRWEEKRDGKEISEKHSNEDEFIKGI